MRITVRHRDGRITEFNADRYTTSDAFKGEGGPGARNIMTEFCLRLDLLREKGLFLEIFWQNAVNDAQTRVMHDDEADVDVPVTGRELGRFVQLISVAELDEIYAVYVDGEMVLCRCGGQLVNVEAWRAWSFDMVAPGTKANEFARKAEAAYTELGAMGAESPAAIIDDARAACLGFPEGGYEAMFKALRRWEVGGEDSSRDENADMPGGEEVE